jgi:predicted nucleotidyltransferase
MKSLAHYLLGQTRSSVLSALLLHPEASLHVRELARLTGTHAGSLHRELRALAELGLLVRQEIGRQVHYRANTQSPVFDELTGLLRKTAGVADILRNALLPLVDQIDAAFVYGSMASGDTHVHSDVDVMLVGALSFADAVLALQPAQEALSREVNPTVFGLQEFQRRRDQRDNFVARLWKEPKLWLIGEVDELEQPGQD